MEEWLFGTWALTDHWNDQSLSDAAARLEGEEDSNQMVDGDIKEALIQKALDLFQGDDWGELTSTHINELLSREKITEEEAEEWREDQNEAA